MQLRKLLLLLLALPASAGAGPPDGAAEVRSAWSILEKHQDGFWLDGEAASPALLERWYSALRRWTAAELERGGASALAASAKRLGASGDAAALPLPGGGWLVAAGNGSFGTVFTLAPRDGHLIEAWNLAAPAGSGSPALTAWRADHARPLCKGDAPCGPLGASVRMLPPEADGSARFLVLGTYSFPLGATAGGQISVWRWRNGAAEPLFVKVFSYLLEDGVPLEVEGGLIRLHAKESWKHLAACGGCRGRDVEWRWRVGADDIRLLGSRSSVPEIDLVDAVIGRIVARRGTADLATPAAAGAVRRLLKANRDPAWIGAPEGGMLNGWTRRSAGARTFLCLSAEDMGSATYQIERRSGRLRLVAVVPRRDADAGCGKGARS